MYSNLLELLAANNIRTNVVKYFSHNVLAPVEEILKTASKTTQTTSKFVEFKKNVGNAFKKSITNDRIADELIQLCMVYNNINKQEIAFSSETIAKARAAIPVAKHTSVVIEPINAYKPENSISIKPESVEAVEPVKNDIIKPEIINKSETETETETEPKVKQSKVKPVVDKPIVDEPIIDEPVTDEPVVDEPVIDEPVIDEPVVDEVINNEPVVDEEVNNEPVNDEPEVKEAE